MIFYLTFWNKFITIKVNIGYHDTIKLQRMARRVGYTPAPERRCLLKVKRGGEWKQILAG